MRDISNKVVTLRTATARAVLRVEPETIKRIENNDVPKGDPLPVARVAGIQAAKNTSQIIPYCHQIALEFVGVEFQLKGDAIWVDTCVKASEKTGVEMEALTAASIAALTIYDMVKMFDDSAEIESVTLVRKTGGKSDFQSFREGAKAAVLVMSDRVSKGEAVDASGRIIVERLRLHGIEVVEDLVVPDDETEIASAVRHATDDLMVDLVVTTGGTGIGLRDCTPEALGRLIEKPLPGVSEAIRSYGQHRNPFAMLARGCAGVRNKSVVVSLPGSKGGVEDGLDVLLPYILHAIPMLAGHCHDEHKHGHDENTGTKSGVRTDLRKELGV